MFTIQSRRKAELRHKRLIAIKPAEPTPGRRIDLAWRRGFTQHQGIHMIRSAARTWKMPILKLTSV